MKLKVKKVSIKTGEKNGKPWKQIKCVFQNEKGEEIEAGTFSDIKIEEGKIYDVKITQSGKFYNIDKIEEIKEEITKDEKIEKMHKEKTENIIKSVALNNATELMKQILTSNIEINLETPEQVAFKIIEISKIFEEYLKNGGDK